MDRRKPGTVFVTLVAAVLTLSAVGCDRRSPQEKIARARTEYQVELNGWVVKGERGPAAEGDVAPEAEAPLEPEVEEPVVEAEAMTGEEGEDLEGAEDTPPEPVLVTVLLNLVVSHDSYDPLPGLTVDVTQADRDGIDKNRHHCWIETADVPRVVPTQVDCVLEGVEVAPDDMFAVQIRHAIAPDEMADYREFQEGS